MADETKKIEKDSSAPVKTSRRYKCRVYRLNTERENANLPIAVNVIGKKRREFVPGEEVILHDYHIEVLRNAVDTTELEVPSESAIYDHADPVGEAQRNFPGFVAKRNRENGILFLEKRLPLYSVEIGKEV